MRFKNILSILSLSISITLSAQKGEIRGKIIEDLTEQPLIGCSVVIEGTSNGSITDFDGNFIISANPEIYNLVSSYVSFTTQKISSVTVKTNGVTIINIRMKELSIADETFELTTTQVKNNEAILKKNNH